VAMEFKVTRTEVKERYFDCERCGARGEVEFHAVGDGGWVRESFWEDDAQGASAMTAAYELELDADRIMRLIRCPACEQRPPGAFHGGYIRVGTPLIIGAIAPFFDREFLWGTFLLVWLAVWLLWRELQRLGRANRAEILKLQYPTNDLANAGKSGTKPRTTAAATKPIPKPAPAPAPVIPVRTSAPEIVQPRGPDDGPRFLD
jgi:hypothetical protein